MTAQLMEGCSSCEHGWRYATDAYVDELIPLPPNGTEEAIAAVLRKREGLYGTFVFPCSECRPEAFRRWANGCFRADHRSSKCDLCLESMGQKAASAHDRAAAGGRRAGGDL